MLPTAKRQKWDPSKSNYNKRGKDLHVTLDPRKIDDPNMAKIAQGIIDLSVPRGKQKALNAKDALNHSGWRKWMAGSRDRVSKLEEFKRNNSIAGRVMDLSEFEQREFINECYEEYLRMAHLGGRSKTTFITNEAKQVVGKQIIEMTFEEYLKDCMRNLDWRMTKDLPDMKHKEEMGFIGIRSQEFDKSLALLKMAKDGIRKYLDMNSKERFLYV